MLNMRARPDRHVGIAGEVEVEPEREGHGRRAKPRAAPRGVPAAAKVGVASAAHRVGDGELLEQADDEEGDAAAKAFLEAVVAGAANCGRSSLWWTIGPAMSCGKKVTKSAVVEQTRRLGASPRVDQEGDLLEGVEGDRQRQRHRAQREVEARQGGDVAGDEDRVFVPASTARLPAMPATISRYASRGRPARLAAMARPSAWLAPIEASNSARKGRLHQP